MGSAVFSMSENLKINAAETVQSQPPFPAGRAVCEKKGLIRREGRGTSRSDHGR